jgi:Protein of unknown function (DUF3551)
MKVFLLGIGIFAASTALTTIAQAQNYPWCAQYGNGMDGARNCGFENFEQCQANVRGIGGFCEPNNTYKAPIGTHRHVSVQQ